MLNNVAARQSRRQVKKNNNERPAAVNSYVTLHISAWILLKL